MSTAIRSYTIVAPAVTGTVALPAGTAVDDVLLLVTFQDAAYGGAAPWPSAPPGGWLLLAEDAPAGGAPPAGGVWWRQVDASLVTTGSIEVTFSGSPGSGAVALIALTGTPMLSESAAAGGRVAGAPRIATSNSVTAPMALAGDQAISVGIIARYVDDNFTPEVPVTVATGTVVGQDTGPASASVVLAIGPAAATGGYAQTFTGEPGASGYFAVIICPATSDGSNSSAATATPVQIAGPGPGSATTPLAFSDDLPEAGAPTLTLYGSSDIVHSAWWSYRPTVTGAATFDTAMSLAYAGGPVDTVMAVYTADGVGGLTLLAVNDDNVLTDSYGAVLPNMHVQAGTTYYVRVGLYGSPVGYRLTVTGPTTYSVPAPVVSSGRGPLVLTPTYRLGEMTFNATDDYGVDWIVGEELGWSDAAPVRLATADREDAHGSFSGPVWRGARLIGLKGVALCPDRVAMLRAKDRLRSAGDYGPDPAMLTVAEAHLTRYTWVKHSTEVRIRDVNSRAFEWELALRADDPLRYGDVQLLTMALPTAPGGGLTFPLTFPFTYGAGLVGGYGTADNAGNAETNPTLSINGPIAAPQVINATTGQVLAADLTLTAGDVLTIDTANRMFAVNGLLRYDALTAASSWWSLAPGANDIRFMASTYDTAPLLTLTWRSAWK